MDIMSGECCEVDHAGPGIALGEQSGVRLPKELALRLGIGDGSRVDVSEDRGRIVISVERPVYTLEELLVGMTPEAMHEAFDWGEDIGRERVE